MAHWPHCHQPGGSTQLGIRHRARPRRYESAPGLAEPLNGTCTLQGIHPRWSPSKPGRRSRGEVSALVPCDTGNRGTPPPPLAYRASKSAKRQGTGGTWVMSGNTLKQIDTRVHLTQDQPSGFSQEPSWCGTGFHFHLTTLAWVWVSLPTHPCCVKPETATCP